MSDKIINASMTEVLRGKEWVSIPWSAVRVGDILRVSTDCRLGWHTSLAPDSLCFLFSSRDLQ